MCNMNFILNPNYIKMNSDPTAFRASLWPPSTSSKRSASPRIPPNRLVAARRSRCRRNAGVKFRVMGVCKVFIAADLDENWTTWTKISHRRKSDKENKAWCGQHADYMFFLMLHVTYKNLNSMCHPFLLHAGFFINLCVLGKLCLDHAFPSPSCCAQGLALSQLPTVSQGWGNPPKNRQMNTDLLIIIHNMGGEVSHHYRSRSPTLTQRLMIHFP